MSFSILPVPYRRNLLKFTFYLNFVPLLEMMIWVIKIKCFSENCVEALKMFELFSIIYSANMKAIFKFFPSMWKP